MSLWELLLVVVFSVATICAVHVARQEEVGFGGYALAVVSGVIIGAGCTITMWKFGEVIGARISKLQPETRRVWHFRALFLSAAVWIFLSAVLGHWVTTGLLRLVK